MHELNKSQLILLALLISFVTSIATGIATVSLMQQAPASITAPINKIVQQTVQKIVQVDNSKDATLSPDQQQLLQDLKAIKPLTVSLYLKGDKDDTLLGTGLFLGENKVVIASVIDQPKDGQVYVVKSVLGEQKIAKITNEKDFTEIELTPADAPTPPADTNTTTTPDTTTTQ